MDLRYFNDCLVFHLGVQMSFLIFLRTFSSPSFSSPVFFSHCRFLEFWVCLCLFPFPFSTSSQGTFSLVFETTALDSWGTTLTWILAGGVLLPRWLRG